MKLKEYLESNGLSTYAFASKMSEAGRDVNQSVVWRWCAEQQRPDWTTVPYITKATKGKVQANDFVLPID